jgi:predicted RNase H-like HicB family nuclease
MELSQMLFPVVVHKDPRSAFGVTVPDLPGCFTAGDTLDEALRHVQEAVEAYLHGQSDTPVPSPIDRWSRDPDYADGFFALVDVNLDFLRDETVRVNITAKRSALALIDRVARAKGEDRSEFLIRAALERAGGVASSPVGRYAKQTPRTRGSPPRKPRRAER